VRLSTDKEEKMLFETPPPDQPGEGGGEEGGGEGGGEEGGGEQSA
jgi:hypothetical protein